MLYVYVIFFGIGFGSRAVIFSALTADIFSGKGFGSILGYSTVAVGVGGALGSYLGGAFYDWTGSYLVSFALSAIVLGCSDICIWLASIPRVATTTGGSGGSAHGALMLFKRSKVQRPHAVTVPRFLLRTDYWLAIRVERGRDV